ncbi:TBC domain-containing protein C1952,17c OS=Schizosaccharomyces pombe (strain 972 / ATCC 24843) GN=SPAC1952.17c PE=4 SV=4 [Rhizoctonia solani AG-1 IB]|uniref:TBC domain-containing protein C1952,17c n=1 Tax=Thanatephorus cucumeris (strain AG1-IB / isolate 7/3/14) TaxID=1108050 RepID=A0A0B7FQ49_THACB|nr:TBC domain-containing protein C1952,17c OS=Schizosaccharomyces pombe (strain 972 / ATCC 24843) GN=SPAC1952.17c PE=4 SV=4 [Rhizoctonia solani AG-1 IB]
MRSRLSAQIGHFACLSQLQRQQPAAMAGEMEQMNYQSRMHAFEEILDSSSALRVVDIVQLRALSLQGIPEHPVWMRSRIWRLLLGALPPEKDKWEEVANKSRMRYYDVAAQLLEPIQTGPPPEYPLNARDKLLDTIAKDVDRTQPRIPFFRQPIDPLQTWPKPTPTVSTSDAEPETTQSDVASSLFDRLAIVQRVVRFGNSAPPPAPRTPEIRVMEVAPPSTNEENNNETHASNTDENMPNANSKENDTHADSSEDDDKPLAFKAGGRSSLGLNLSGLSPHVSPRPPTLQLNGHSEPDDDQFDLKTHAHILLRILYVYSLLHPHHPYTQGLNELLAPLYYAVFEGRSAGLRSYGLGVRHEEMVGEAAIRAAGDVVAQVEGETPAPSLEVANPALPEDEDEEDDPTQHIEADTFWLFVELMGELGSVVGDPGDWSLPPVVSGSGEGVRGVMTRLSDRLKWADARLWEDMVKKSLDPKLPYFSYRWIACLLAQDLPLTALLPTWDTLFAQSPSTPETNPKIEFLINLCVALLLGVRDKLVRVGNKRGGVGLWGEEEEEDDDVPLSMIQPQPLSPNTLPMNEAFVQGMLLLQRYPLESVGLGWVINKAFELGAKRAAGFGIIEQNNVNGAGWGTGAWDVAAAMRNRVAGWRSVSGGSGPASEPEGAASITPVPEVLVSPPGAPSLATVGGKIRQYTETFKQSDAAASLSKASTNWSLAVMSAWNRSGGTQEPQEQSEEAPSPPPRESNRGHGRSGSWAGWGAMAMAAAKQRAAAITKTRAADVPESVAEEPSEEQPTHTHIRTDSRNWEPQDRERQPGDRSQSLSPTALAKVMATTQPFAPQTRTATHPHTSAPTPRSAQVTPLDYEPPPRPAVFKNPRDSWLPTPSRLDAPSSQEDDPNSAPVPSPSHRFTMTLPGWSAMPPPPSPSHSSTAKKTTGPKPLLLGKTRQTTTNTSRFSRVSRQSSISSSTGSHREWELMASLSPRSDSGSIVGRPDSGSYAGRSRRSMGTASMPASAAGSLAPSEDEAVIVGLGLRNASSDQGSPPLEVPHERPTSRELKRTSSPLGLSAETGSDSPRSWQLADGPVTAEPVSVRKWELTDGPADPKAKAETLPAQLDPGATSRLTAQRYQLTDGPAQSKTLSLGVASVMHESPAESPIAPPAPRKWELSDNPVPRIEPHAPALTADSDAADSPILAPGEPRKSWPKRSSSNRPANLNIRTKSRPLSTATITPSGDSLRTPLPEKDLVTPTSATSLSYLNSPSPGATETPLPQTEERTPRRKKQTQADRKSKTGKGAAHTPEVMSEEDGVKADAEDGEDFDEFLSSYETETDDPPAGRAR